jgi:poly-gamma-glutamate synthesis protein (capsule biosynthesis protein)
MRAVIRVGAVGVFLSCALAATLLVRPTTLGDQQVRLTTYGSTTAPLAHHSVRQVPGPALAAQTRAAQHRAPHRAPRHVTVVMSGDLLWHDTVWESAQEDSARAGLSRRFDFGPMFAAMRPVVRGADLAICHEEVPFAEDDQHLSSYPVFAAPPEVAPWIAGMGWDACTTDSNHSIDQGYDGLVRTADLLERNGVRHVGTFRTPSERRRPVIVTTKQGVRVGIVGGTYSLNGLTLPPDKQWAVSTWDADNLIAQARAAKAAGADIVLVQYHGGDEYSRLPNAEQVALVRRLTASPAVDLVFAEHAHVVQPITQVNGKWVVYGMGNMVAQSDPRYPRAYEGITVRFRFTETHGAFHVDRAAYIPTYWNHYAPGTPIRIQRVDRALALGAPDRARLLEAQQMTRLAVDGLATRGGTTPPLRER